MTERFWKSKNSTDTLNKKKCRKLLILSNFHRTLKGKQLGKG